MPDQKSPDLSANVTHSLLFHLENSPLASVQWDEDFKVQAWSPRAEQLFGWSAHEILGKHPQDWGLIHPDDFAEVQALIQKMMDGETQGGLHRNRNLTREGRVIECEWFNSAIFDKNGKFLSTLSLVLDVTERQADEARRVQKLMSLSYQRFKELADTMPLTLYVHDAQDNTLYMSRQWERYTGQEAPVTEAIWQAVTHPEDGQRTYDIWKQCLKTGQEFSDAVRLKGRDGTYRWFQSRAVPVRDPEGRIFQWVGTLNDIEEQRQASDALALAESRLQLALECGGTATFEFDLLRTTPTRVSANHHKLFGLPGPDPLWDDKKFLDAVHPEDRLRVSAADQNLIQAPGTEYQIEYRVIWPDGSVHWLSEKGRHVVLHGQSLVLGACTDITPAKEAQEMAQTALKLRDEFISVAAHELRTPIASSHLALESLERILFKKSQDTWPMEKIQRMLSNALHQTFRLGTLVSRLLDLSKIRHGKLALERKPSDLSALVERAIESLELELREQECPVERDLSPKLLGDWDTDRIEQVAVNLVSNAAKFAPGKPVAIRTYRSGDFAILEVRDQGPGIPSGEQSRVFDRFERVSTAEGTTGLGLGLFIADELVRAHGGQIEVDSALGQGSTFRVRLPIEGSPQIR